MSPRTVHVAFLSLLLPACAAIGPRPAPRALPAAEPTPYVESAPASNARSAATAATRAEPVTLHEQQPGAQQPGAPPPLQRKPSWQRGAVAMHGFFGAAFYEASREGGTGSGNIDDDDATFPVIGGGAQWKLGGERIDFGLEGLLSFAWSGDVAAFVSGGAGGAVAVDVNMLIFDLYGGPFVSMFLGDEDNIRIHAGAGPLLRWGNYDQDGPTLASSGDGSGEGFGWYARTGVEFALAPGTMLGVIGQWSQAEMDLSGGLGDLDLDGFQFGVSVTKGF